MGSVYASYYKEGKTVSEANLRNVNGYCLSEIHAALPLLISRAVYLTFRNAHLNNIFRVFAANTPPV